MSQQTKLESFVEACINILIGYVIAVSSQYIIFPIYGIELPASAHMEIGLFFTVVSLIRSYLLRRLFNRRSTGKVIKRTAKKLKVIGTKVLTWIKVPHIMD